MTLSTVLFVTLFTAIVARPIEVRLWRKGRISDRAAAVLLLARLPLLVFFGLLLGGAGWVLAVVVTAPLILIERLAYPFIRTVLDDARKESAAS